MVVLDDSVNPIDDESGVDMALTPIHTRIHCAATGENLDSENELDQIAIDNFLDTLVEVTLAIIRRRQIGQ